MFGQVPRVDITLEHHGDFRMEVRWWSDKDKTAARNVSAVAAAVTARNGQVLLDLAPFVTVAGNTMTFLVRAADVAGVAPALDRRWYLTATDAATGVATKLLKGTAVVNE